MRAVSVSVVDDQDVLSINSALVNVMDPAFWLASISVDPAGFPGNFEGVGK